MSKEKIVTMCHVIITYVKWKYMAKKWYKDGNKEYIVG